MARPGRLPLWALIPIALHVAAITIWTTPPPPEGVRLGRYPAQGIDVLLLANRKALQPLPGIGDYLRISGMWQYWDMFAPNPSRSDIVVGAVVRRRSGKEEEREFVRIAKLDTVRKYLKERYRKFGERIAYGGAGMTLIPVCAAAARDAWRANPNDPPVEVELVRYEKAIPPPGVTDRSGEAATIFYRWAVDPRRSRP